MARKRSGLERRWTKMTPELRCHLMHLAAQGYSARSIAGQVHVSIPLVLKTLRSMGGAVQADMLRVGARALSLEERVEVMVGLSAGDSVRAIAARLGRAPSTISREVARHGGRDGYRPVAAHRQALVAARRPKPAKLSSYPALLARVAADLERLWSPQQIAARLVADFGHDASMTVSHETIYKTLYLQGRGELRRELARFLRTGRQARRHQGRLEQRGRIVDMTMVSERPAEAADRAVPGHWEGDLIVGKGNKSAIGTLVERATRFVMLFHLGQDHTAPVVREALTAKVRQLPAQLARSLTWDQGAEMAEHARFSIDTGVKVYFCDPHSPWMRGSNENTNGLLRQYFPKGTDLSVHSPADLDAVAASLNGRPRQTLGWMTPSEKLDQFLVAMTA
jgi:IS30 family transposase